MALSIISVRDLHPDPFPAPLPDPLLQYPSHAQLAFFFSPPFHSLEAVAPREQQEVPWSANHFSTLFICYFISYFRWVLLLHASFSSVQYPLWSSRHGTPPVCCPDNTTQGFWVGIATASWTGAHPEAIQILTDPMQQAVNRVTSSFGSCVMWNHTSTHLRRY